LTNGQTTLAVSRHLSNLSYFLT